MTIQIQNNNLQLQLVQTSQPQNALHRLQGPLVMHSLMTRIIATWQSNKHLLPELIRKEIESLLIIACYHVIDHAPINDLKQSFNTLNASFNNIQPEKIAQLVAVSVQPILEKLANEIAVKEGVAQMERLKTELSSCSSSVKKKSDKASLGKDSNVCKDLEEIAKLIVELPDNNERKYIAKLFGTTPYYSYDIQTISKKFPILLACDATIELNASHQLRFKLHVQLLKMFKDVFSKNAKTEKSLLVIGSDSIGLLHLVVGSLLGYSIQMSSE